MSLVSPAPDVQSLTVPVAATLLGLGVAVAGLLTHSLRKARTDDWVVAVGWGLGGSVAVGTGLWLLQLLAWRQVQPGAAPWFETLPFALAWAAGVAGVAVSLFVARWMPRPKVSVGAMLLFLVPTLAMVFVAAGASMVPAPRWDRIEGAPVAAALLILVAGVGAALGLIDGPRQPWLRGEAVQRVAGMLVFAVTWLLAQGVALRAAPMDFVGPGLALPSPDAVDPRLAGVVMMFAGALVTLAVLAALVDSRGGRRASALAGSLQTANRRLEELAYSDALSGLPNRLHFEERLDRTLAQVGRQAGAMAVLFVDLDGFKAVNETFGHAAGDDVLREVGLRLARITPAPDLAARAGGDEFLLLLTRPGSSEAAAEAAQRALHALTAPYALPGGSDVRLSCSIGIAMFPEHGPTTRLIANADAAMFAVKRTGGSTYAFFEPRMGLEASDQLELQTELRGAVERGQLELFYQPKIDARTRAMTGVEALVRWQHPLRGAVGPSELIAVAERFGLIGGIGQWVIDEACRQIRQWDGQGLRIRVAINLSAQQLRQDDLVQRIRQSFAAHRVDPSLVTFEITETVAMEDTQTTMRAFAQLARAGVSLAIDDFGTGHSSLAYLRTLPARQLKIDRSFIGDLGQSADALAVVDAVIRLAHALGLRVVAEGVETETQSEILSGLGCDEFQGYLFARPMPPQRLALWASGEAGALTPLESASSAGVMPPRSPRTLQ